MPFFTYVSLYNYMLYQDIGIDLVSINTFQLFVLF